MTESVVPLSPLARRRRRRRRVLVVLLAIALFISGLVVGSGLTVLVIYRRVRHLWQHTEEVPDRLAERLKSRLHLQPEQVDKVREIIAAHQAHLREVRASVAPQVRTELDGVHTDVEKVLDPGQREEWDRVYGNFMREWSGN